MSHRGAEPSLTTPRAASPGGSASLANIGTPPGSRVASALATRALTKSYHAGIHGCSGRVQALRGIDLDVVEGEALGVVGPSGAGKSTLLLCLAGMLRPDGGTVAWFGRVADEAGRPPGIAYVARHPAPYSVMSVREAVEYHSTIRSVGAGERAAAVQTALEETGLAHEARMPVGGLQRAAGVRLCLAQALVGRPRVLLLDETFSGLTTPDRREVDAVLRPLIDRGVTVVIAADTLDTAGGTVDRVALMIDGRLAAIVEPGELRHSRVIELTVATPALARRIFGSRVAEVGWNRHIVRLPLDGTSAEEILARCHASGIRIETSRIVSMVEHSRDDETESARPC